MRTEARRAAREKEARLPAVVGKEDGRDGRVPATIERSGAACEAREMLAGPRTQRLVETVERYRWLE